MADYKTEKLPPQQWFTDQIKKDPPSIPMGFLAGMNDGQAKGTQLLTLGFAPSGTDAIARYGNIPPEAAEKINQAVMETRPWAYTAGVPFGAALSVGGALKAGSVLGLNKLASYLPAFARANPIAASTVAAGSGYVADKNMGGNVMSYVQDQLGLNSSTPAAPAATPAKPAETEPPIIRSEAAPPREPTDMERMQAMTGLSGDQLAIIASRNGGNIPVALMKDMGEMRPKAPGYKDVSFDMFNRLNASQWEALNARGASDAEKAAFREEQRKAYASFLGADLADMILGQQ